VRWHAKQVGEKARDLLRGPAFSGTVAAVLRTSVYLTGGEGEMLWIARQGVPMHRRAVVCSLPVRGLVPGEAFTLQGPWVQIGGRLAITVDQAEEWAPPLVGPGEGESLDTVYRSICRLLAALPVPGEDWAFGQVLALLRAAFHGRDLHVLPRRFFLTGPATGAIYGLIHACLRQDVDQVARAGRELVGLGAGLSPSGDDFLGGLLFAARSLQRAYPGEFHWEVKPIRELLEWARPKTHPLSHTLLSDLALCHGPEPLHALLALLLRAGEERQLMWGVARLTAIGHHSGWDMLAGFLTGMLAVAGRLGGGQTAPA
jgi:hypothetical protein